MQAVILAGGAGTRLGSLVSDKPKSMAGFADKPFLEYQFELLRQHGIDEVLLCTGYLHEHIERHCGDGSRWGLRLRYSVEPSPLGTGGALKRAEPELDDTFLLLNGDSFLELDLGSFVEFHRDKRRSEPRCLGTLALARVSDASAYGAVHVDGGLRILAYAEKALAGAPWISAGVYVLERALLADCAPEACLSLEREVLPAALGRGAAFFGFPTAGFFTDIGTPQGYRTFRNFIEGNIEGNRHDH